MDLLKTGLHRVVKENSEKTAGWLSTKEIGQHPDLPSREIIVRLFKTNKINDVWEELNIFGI